MFNRGTLMKLAQAGKLVMVEAYHFDDMTGSERNNKELPVRVRRPDEDWHDWPEGVCHLWEHDFKSKSGRAWENPNGTITLVVHSNSNYTFRRI